MKAETIYNKAITDLTDWAKYELLNIFNLRVGKGITDPCGEVAIDPWEYGEDADKVIVWGDNDYNGAACVKEITIAEIALYGEENIVIRVDEDEMNYAEEIPFADLPMNSMVFVCNILENIYKKEVENW